MGCLLVAAMLVLQGSNDISMFYLSHHVVLNILISCKLAPRLISFCTSPAKERTPGASINMGGTKSQETKEPIGCNSAGISGEGYRSV